MALIDISYFVGDLELPNTDQEAVLEQVNWFIGKYEQEFLRKLLGYPLYKAFVAGLNVTPPSVPAQRFLDILYGKEYTNLQGYLTKWRGLIITDNPVFSMSGEAVYKPPVTITAGITPGLVEGATSFVFDGTNGTLDWRGWIPILFRSSPMEEGVDYSWDKDAGELHLLISNDKFGPGEKFFAQFQTRTTPLPNEDVSPNQSPIADYIYYWIRRKNWSQTTAIGEVQANAENSTLRNPNEKMARAWNEMSDMVGEFIEFMDTNTSLAPEIYPEWLWIYRWDTIREFQFINPIF